MTPPCAVRPLLADQGVPVCLDKLSAVPVGRPDPGRWTRELSMHDLYVITSNTTDRQTWREAMAEIDRRDELAAS